MSDSAKLTPAEAAALLFHMTGDLQYDSKDFATAVKKLGAIVQGFNGPIRRKVPPPYTEMIRDAAGRVER